MGMEIENDLSKKLEEIRNRLKNKKKLAVVSFTNEIKC
jgi:hypothetical protein